MAKKHKYKKKGGSTILNYVANNDPTRYHDRIIQPEKGNGRKDRPRQKNWNNYDETFASAA